MSTEFRLIGPAEEPMLRDVFGDIDEAFFRPHPFTGDEAARIAAHGGEDVYSILVVDGRPAAYGMLRGWSEGYPVPSLGIAVRTSAQGRGLGRTLMGHLHEEAARRGATVVRLRVHPDNVRARRLYETMGYAYAGEERGELVMLLDIGDDAQPGREVRAEAPALSGRLLHVGDPEWTATLREARHDFYHLPAYVALSAVHEGGQPTALYVSDGARTMLLPLLVREMPDGGRDASSPYGYPGPIGTGSDDPAFLRVALVAGIGVLRAQDIVTAFIRLHPLLNPAPPRGVGALVAHGDTVSVDLRLPAEELWAGMRLNHRRDITRAVRLGYAAAMDPEWEQLETFKRLYRETMERHAAASFYFFSDAYFEGLRTALGDRLHLCIVRRDDAVVAAGLFVETGGIVEYHLSGTADAFRAIQPTKLMMHHVQCWARERGDEVLHLGGGVGGAADSLLQFKVGFSPRRHAFSTLRIVIDEQEYQRLVGARDPRLDPRDRTGYFPAYRDPGHPASAP